MLKNTITRQNHVPNQKTFLVIPKWGPRNIPCFCGLGVGSSYDLSACLWPRSGKHGIRIMGLNTRLLGSEVRSGTSTNVILCGKQIILSHLFYSGRCKKKGKNDLSHLCSTATDYFFLELTSPQKVFAENL